MTPRHQTIGRVHQWVPHHRSHRSCREPLPGSMELEVGFPDFPRPTREVGGKRAGGFGGGFLLVDLEFIFSIRYPGIKCGDSRVVSLAGTLGVKISTANGESSRLQRR